MIAATPSFRCPFCRSVSHHPRDVQEPLSRALSSRMRVGEARL
jgi:hypothetical protein